MAEQLAVNQCVAGSNPAPGAFKVILCLLKIFILVFIKIIYGIV